MNNILRQRKKDIPNLAQIKVLYKQGFTIRSLSLNFQIPYATLYRALMGRIDRSRAEWASKKKSGCYFCRRKSIQRSNIIHHIDCDRSNNSHKNLVELCPSCHRRLHRRIYNKLIKGGKLKVASGERLGS